MEKMLKPVPLFGSLAGMTTNEKVYKLCYTVRENEEIKSRFFNRTQATF